MFSEFFYRVRSIRYAKPFSDAWFSLYYYWHTREKFHFILVTIVSLIITGFSLVIYDSFNEKKDIQNLTCLALNVYHEARGEPTAGQYAVAKVTMNRVASKHYPDTICQVVFQKNWDWLRRRYVSAFSWTELKTIPKPEGKAWERAWQAAEALYNNPQSSTERTELLSKQNR